MSPLYFLGIVVFVTAGARLVYALATRRRRQAIQKLAREWSMHYSARDRFNLSDRVAQRFPTPGAAELRVLDLIYGTEQNHYRYIFSAEYTLGVTHGKRRVCRVVTFREPKGRSTEADWSPLVLAPADVPLLEQYASLHRQITSP